VFDRARSLIYVEDQYLWSEQIAALLARALERAPELRVIAVVPRFPDRDGTFSGPPNRIGQELAMGRVMRVARDRIAVYDVESETGWPIYVHAKVCVVDDVWAAVGSDNLNRRSWTHDSELSCAVMDETTDPREPADPGGLGDGARVFPRELRLGLWREHLGPDAPEEEMLDPLSGFELWHQAARALDGWHEAGRSGPRPPGRVRAHAPDPIPAWASWWSRPAYRYVVDPDGRPAHLRTRNRL
jgi:phosphatidylserine/phosphatidylglycerophosphate/cardiolipin synthase-like enzyme